MREKQNLIRNNIIKISVSVVVVTLLYLLFELLCIHLEDTYFLKDLPVGVSIILTIRSYLPVLASLVVLITLFLCISFLLIWGAQQLFTSFRQSSATRNISEEKASILTPEVAGLNKLVEYTQKRKEIDEEIERLTFMLTHSSINEYLDVNRLVIQGQSDNIGNGTIDYSNFLKQFGIDAKSISIRKNFAIFLTPFNSSGNRAYSICQTTLNQLGIILQRTDNVVDKNDIMMNIVSQIVRAEFLIVNIDGRNPNVYYELGIAHAIGKPTILISSTKSPEQNIDFDLRQKYMILYNSDRELETELLYQINRMRSQ